MKTTEKYVLFWSGIYSQWYKAEMTINGNKYKDLNLLYPVTWE